MFKFIFRRTLYSALIIVGVLILTFSLFRVASGDPAAAVLGKKSSPLQIETLRVQLGSNRPLFFGYWVKSEVFASTDFTEKRKYPTCELIDVSHIKDESCIFLGVGSRVVFKRNFIIEDSEIIAEVSYKGDFVCDNKMNSSSTWTTVRVTQQVALEEFVVTTNKNGCKIRSIQFYRKQKSPFNSQLISSLNEIVSFKSTFPYICFLNFGNSLITKEPIKRILWRGVWPSLMLMVPIFIGELVIGIVLALFATAYKGTWIDKSIVMVSIVGMSISYLVFIILGQWYLGYYFNLFPVWGYGDIRHLILPIGIGIFSGLGGGVRFYRTIFINELNKEYLRTAESKGCTRFSIYYKHLLRNAAIPIITRASTVIPFLFTGSLLLEKVFGIPGLGYAGINALANSDIQVIKALVILGSFLFIFINLITDVVYAWVDPRVRVK